MSRLTEEVLERDFQVIRILGAGSFGQVFLVRNIVSNRQFAMKKYSNSYLLQSGKDKSIIRSLSILQQLNHPGIIKFMYYGKLTKCDSYILLFEACKKGSLQKIRGLLKKAKDINIVTYIMYQLAEALSYLKKMQVAHRDIKPSNITFTSEGILKIIDFDEAIIFNQEAKDNRYDFDINQEQPPSKLVRSKKSIQENYANNNGPLHSRRSLMNSYVGTDYYMCPQMIFDTKADQKADVWAFGLILYELVIGQPFQIAFQKFQSISHFQQTFSDTLQELQKKQKINSDCADLLKKILVTNPQKRIIGEEILNHPFFKRIKYDKIYYQKLKSKFAQMLRSNPYTNDLESPKTLKEDLKDAHQYDLKDMRLGKQRFQKLQTVIFMKQQNRFEMYYLMGGYQYFKFLNVNNDKQSIFNQAIKNIFIMIKQANYQLLQIQLS